MLTQLETEAGLKALYAMRGPEIPPSNVVIIGIDHESASRLQISDEPNAWPRRLHADIIRTAQKNEAAFIAFDIFFAGPSPDAGADQSMAEAMKSMGGVVLTDYVKPRQAYAGVYVESIVEPTPQLAEAAFATTPFLLPKSSYGASQFLTFFGGEEERATLPTVLLSAYIRHIGFEKLVDGITQMGRKALPAEVALIKQPQSSKQRQGVDLSRTIQHRDMPEATERLLRSLLRIYREGNVRYFNHYGPARSFPTIPYHQLVTSPAETLRSQLRGKIILVGYLEDFQPENTEGVFFSPFSPVSSVELAATALANLLENKSVQPVFSPLVQPFWYLLWGLILGLLAQSISVRRGIAGISLLSSIYLAAAWWLFRANGYWLPMIIPLALQAPIALIGSLALNYQRQARHEKKVQSVIQRFIPVDVFSQLTRQESNITLPAFGRLAQGVCVATDAGRYTALAENMEPMALARLMNQYYEAIFPPVTRRGGWISDVMGDAMLAIWIVGEPSSNPCREALEAAEEIAEAVSHFEQHHQLEFPIRMGLHYGELRIGYVGTSDRGEIRAVGDTVNTAARLEGLNKLLGTQILASTTVLEGFPARRSRAVGRFLLAGKSKPINVVELATATREASLTDEFRKRFAECLALFADENWPEAHACFTRLALQFPDDGPTSFYQKTCQAYMADPALRLGSAGIPVEKPAPARPLA